VKLLCKHVIKFVTNYNISNFSFTFIYKRRIILIVTDYFRRLINCQDLSERTKFFCT
jgi:hypothetical protein